MIPSPAPALSDYQATETLPGGQLLRLRAIRPQDRAGLRSEFLKLSKASVRDRFFSIKLDLTPAELSYFTEVDFDQHVALVAELQTDAGCRPAAVARLVRKPGQPQHAEIAITVTDALQGMGIGRIMLRRLIDCARDLGIHHVDASVLADNKRMMKLIRKTGLPFDARLQQGIQTISVHLKP
jgi:RimJ/RimL family protein N-acetyltransferase